jgi:hypothetical protein
MKNVPEHGRVCPEHLFRDLCFASIFSGFAADEY